jgi:hypothetical protein
MKSERPGATLTLTFTVHSHSNRDIIIVIHQPHTLVRFTKSTERPHCKHIQNLSRLLEKTFMISLLLQRVGSLPLTSSSRYLIAGEIIPHATPTAMKIANLQHLSYTRNTLSDTETNEGGIIWAAHTAKYITYDLEKIMTNFIIEKLFILEMKCIHVDTLFDGDYEYIYPFLFNFHLLQKWI